MIKMQRGRTTFLIRSVKVIGWFFLSILTLLLTVIALIQIPAIQKELTRRAISYLEEKLGTDVGLESLYVSFPKNIVLKGLYLEDQSGDTLLSAGKVSVNTDLWALTKREIQINKVEVESTLAFIRRLDEDSLFNYSYILKAFAGDSTAVPDTLEQEGWDFRLQSVALDEVGIRYNDHLTGNDLNVALGTLKLSMDDFDLLRYKFSIGDLKLADTEVSLIQTKLPETTVEVARETTDTVNFDLDFDKLDLEGVSAVYTQEATGQRMALDIGHAFVDANRIDVANRLIDVATIELDGNSFSFRQNPQGSGQKDSTSGQDASGENPSWKIKVDRISADHNSFEFLDFTKPEIRGAFDPYHLRVTNIELYARDLLSADNDLRCRLENFAFKENGGFNLKTFQTLVVISEDSAAVSDLLLETLNSRIRVEATAVYESLAGLSENLSEAFVRANISGTHIGLEDLFYFKPALRDSLPTALPAGTNITIDASFSGLVRELRLHHLELRALADTYLNTSGVVVGLPETDQLNLDIALEKFYTTRSDLMTILPDTLLPDSLAPPEWINVNGDFKGNFVQSRFKAMLATSIGSAGFSGDMDLDSTSATRGFNVSLEVNEFDLGALLMQPETIGKIDLIAAARGTGLTMDEMDAEMRATVNSFEYNGYHYEDFGVSAAVKDEIFRGRAALRDEHLEFNLEGDINFQKDVPRYDFTFDLRNADFKALRLAERPLKARGIMEVDMATADLRVLNGSLGIRKVAIFNGDKLYAVDSLLFASIDQEGRSEIKINSDIMDGRFEGSINVFTMPAVVREYFNTYYALHDSVEQSYEEPQHFNFHLNLKKTELLTGLIFPQLRSFEPGEIKGAFNSKEKKLNLRFNISSIRYANTAIESLRLSTNSDPTELNYNLLVDEVMIDSMRIDGIEFNGTVADDSIRTNIVVRDSLDLYKYVISGTFFSRDKAFELRLDTNDIRLNYEYWSVPADNFIRFGGERLTARNVELANGNERIIIHRAEDPGSPLLIGFRQLNLEYLTSMIAEEKPVSGLLQGDILLYIDEDPLQFTSDIKVNDLAVSERAWGDLAVSVEQRVADRFDLHFMLVGDAADIRAEGFYASGEDAAMDLSATITRLDLSMLEPLLRNEVADLTGSVTGAVTAGGTMQRPDLDGSITMRNVAFYSKFLQTSFTVQDESIAFEDRGIAFDGFRLVDVNNNTATLDGMIFTSDYRNYTFGLDLSTRRFQLLNTTEEDNELFYGRLNVNSRARIRGTLVNPDVEMEVSLTDGDHLTYIVPQEQATILEQQGIVRFVDKTFKGDPFMKKIQSELTDTVKTTFRGMDLTAKVELTDAESLTIIIDPTTEDQLTIRGNTTLTFQMDRTGDVRLSGRYEISEGTYNLSFYKFVKREFSIEQGSSMTWSGDPLNASMDIRAIYRVETSPVELLTNQLTTPEEINRYRQRLPFLVYLQIDGQLLEPEITFRLDMPMDERNAFGGNVYARLQDINTRESDLNKQVFALLILKRFIADNPFENNAGSGFEGTARTSVSKILTEQLNQLSENIRGVELSFDVKSYQDYSTGTAQGQTELQLGLSKRLLDDRLVVKLSGNVDIEGQNTNREVTDYIGDLAIEYLLTEDGRFRITGFRNSNYDMIDGELIETGAGLIYIKDYNSLRELFRANPENQK